MRIVVTGGAGFMGSAVCRHLVAGAGATVLCIDRLGATSSLASLSPIAASPRYAFRRADIADREHLAALLNAFAPDAVVHAAAETRASSRIGGAAPAVETNVVCTFRLLEAVREYWSALPEHRRARFRLVSISNIDGHVSPAAATRAAGDELVLGWQASHGLPTMVAQAAATFGPCQFPDAPVPSAVLAALRGQACEAFTGPATPWLYADDHARAVALMLEKGVPGASYAIAGRGLAEPAAVANRVAELVERHGARRSPAIGKPQAARETVSGPAMPPRRQFVEAAARLEQDTGWRPEETLESALSKTVRWYLGNEAWWRPLSAARSGGNDYGVLRIA